MALQLTRTDPSTNVTYPNAYLRIDDFRGSLADTSLVVKLNTYVDAGSAKGGFQPVLPADVLQLTPTEIATMIAALKQSLYTILAARTAYAGATNV